MLAIVTYDTTVYRKISKDVCQAVGRKEPKTTELNSTTKSTKITLARALKEQRKTELSREDRMIYDAVNPLIEEDKTYKPSYLEVVQKVVCMLSREHSVH